MPDNSIDMRSLVFKQTLALLFVVLLSTGCLAYYCFQTCPGTHGMGYNVVNCGRRSCVIMHTRTGTYRTCALNAHRTEMVRRPGFTAYYCNGDLCNDYWPLF